MGMQFSPMYQPVSTKTIKADGDLNVSPYDVIAYDGKFDTVEADEFVGGVGNFSSLTMPTLGYNGYFNVSFSDGYTVTQPILCSPYPVSGVASVKGSFTNYSSAKLCILSKNGLTEHIVTGTQTEYTVTDALNVYVVINAGPNGVASVTIGTPILT